ARRAPAHARSDAWLPDADLVRCRRDQLARGQRFPLSHPSDGGGVTRSVRSHRPCSRLSRPAPACAVISNAAGILGPMAYAQADGAKLYYEDTGGDGTPVILVHANVGNSQS